jgi:hypothetical protein
MPNNKGQIVQENNDDKYEQYFSVFFQKRGYTVLQISIGASVDHIVSADCLKTMYHKLFIFHIFSGCNKKMTRIDFGVTTSKFKVTRALNVKMVSTHYLENY